MKVKLLYINSVIIIIIIYYNLLIMILIIINYNKLNYCNYYNMIIMITMIKMRINPKNCILSFRCDAFPGRHPENPSGPVIEHSPTLRHGAAPRHSNAVLTDHAPCRLLRSKHPTGRQG